MSSELGPKPIEKVSLNVIEASVDRTVSDRFKELGEKARSVIRMVTKRTALTGGALALLISSGCSNTEQINTPIPAEPTPISRPISAPTAETVKTPEKAALTDVEFVSNLLETYLNLDADSRLKRLRNKNLLGAELVKTSVDSRDHLVELPLSTFELKSNDVQITHRINSANLTITSSMQDGRVLTSIGFPIDENGVIVRGDPRLATNKPLPTKEELYSLVLSGTRDFSRFLRHKPQQTAWSVDNSGLPTALLVMNSRVNSPDGEEIKYSVGGTGGQPLDAFVSVRD